MAVLIGTLLVHSAYAGGPPPKNVMKGIFTQLDPAAKTVTIKVDGHDDLRILNIGPDVNIDKIVLDKKVMVSLDPNAGPNVIKDISLMFFEMTVTKVIALLIIGLIGGLLVWIHRLRRSFRSHACDDVSGSPRCCGSGQQYVP